MNFLMTWVQVTTDSAIKIYKIKFYSDREIHNIKPCQKVLLALKRITASPWLKGLLRFHNISKIICLNLLLRNEKFRNTILEYLTSSSDKIGDILIG